MTQHYFCTLFDSGYLLKGVAMLRSLKRHCQNAKVFVLCMDAQTQQILEGLDLPFVSCISLPEIEDDALLEVKPGRDVAEYCWTLSPCLPWYVLQKHPEIDFITYLDADLLFYSPVQPLFEEIGNSSIAIIEHRFSERFKDRVMNGRFCVEWVSFRRDEQGMACLARWRQQCIAWCFNRTEDGKMGDQKYLDEWPSLYSRCHILQHVGAGIAPWNYAQYRFTQDTQGAISVEGEPLLFYHFHQFQLLDNGSFDRLSTFYTLECAEPDAVYRLYERDLMECLVQVRAVVPGFASGMKPAPALSARRLAHLLMPVWAKKALRRLLARSVA